MKVYNIKHFAWSRDDDHVAIAVLVAQPAEKAESPVVSSSLSSRCEAMTIVVSNSTSTTDETISTAFTVIGIILLVALGMDLVSGSFARHFRTRRYYKRARAVGKEQSKDLIVIGDPCVGNWCVVSVPRGYSRLTHNLHLQTEL